MPSRATDRFTTVARSRTSPTLGVTHHLGRLQSETSAQLCSAPAGIRPTATGQLLAELATQIIQRIDAAGAQLSAHVGLTAGRARLAALAIGSLAPAAVAALANRHPDLEISLTDTHPPEAIELVRTGMVGVAVISATTSLSRAGCAFSTCSTIRSTCCWRRVTSAGWPTCARRPGALAAKQPAALNVCRRLVPTADRLQLQ